MEAEGAVYHVIASGNERKAVFRDDGDWQKYLDLLIRCRERDSTHVMPYAIRMPTITASRARSQLYRLLDQTAESHEPITITGKRHDAVLISEDDWRAIEETLYLLSIPGMRESIRNGMRTPLSKTSKRPGW